METGAPVLTEAVASLEKLTGASFATDTDGKAVPFADPAVITVGQQRDAWRFLRAQQHFGHVRAAMSSRMRASSSLSISTTGGLPLRAAAAVTARSSDQVMIA